MNNTIYFAAIALLAAFASPALAGDYVAHEWGTFTSVQGGDGALLAWHPLRSSDLPAFVHDWSNAGFHRYGPSLGPKGSIVSLQRMETPVIYFYADKKQTVDVTVQFPQGFLTEWYPQCDTIGPEYALPTPAGFDPSFFHVQQDSAIRWSPVTIQPVSEHPHLEVALPVEQGTSHYFAARAVDSAYLRVNTETNDASEWEKFLFYRGVGNFATHLRATTDANGVVTLANTGSNNLTHLLVLNVHDGQGTYSSVESLKPGQGETLAPAGAASCKSAGDLCKAVSDYATASLIAEGLFPREAAAMVATWKDSWFAEDGMRVLYVLPRAWTDATLPLRLAPAPANLVRVMVGRAEIIPPSSVRHLHEELAKVNPGGDGSKDLVLAELKRFGRFADPAWQLASKGLAPAAINVSSNLLQSLVVDNAIQGAAN